MTRMSFALTTPQIKARTKTVTRRLGWGTKTVTRRLGWALLKPGDRIAAVEKVMGFKKGEKAPAPIAELIVVSVRREQLSDMLKSPAYGKTECVGEGFPELTPAEFVAMFCRTHKGCLPQSFVTRIEFRYADESGRPAVTR